MRDTRKAISYIGAFAAETCAESSRWNTKSIWLAEEELTPERLYRILSSVMGTCIGTSAGLLGMALNGEVKEVGIILD